MAMQHGRILTRNLFPNKGLPFYHSCVCLPKGKIGLGFDLRGDALGCSLRCWLRRAISRLCQLGMLIQYNYIVRHHLLHRNRSLVTRHQHIWKCRWEACEKTPSKTPFRNGRFWCDKWIEHLKLYTGDHFSNLTTSKAKPFCNTSFTFST